MFIIEYQNGPICEIDMKVTIYKLSLADSQTEVIIQDNGGRRTGADRRNFSYSLHIPERRGGDDRRNGKDRRKTPRFKIKY